MGESAKTRLRQYFKLILNFAIVVMFATVGAVVGGATFLGRENDLGRIAVGYRADIIGVHSNPLEDIENTRDLALVIRDGQSYDDIVSRQ